MMDDVSKFVESFAGGDSKKKIEIYDKNAQFRRNVAEYLIEHPHLASYEIMDAILRQESILFRNPNPNAQIFFNLLSLYIEKYPGAAPGVVAYVGFSMDVDGALQSGALKITAAAKEEAIRTVEQFIGNRTSPNISILKNALSSAELVSK